MEKCKDCGINCRDYRDLVEHMDNFKHGADRCIVFKPKEVKINLQFTEEEARWFLWNCVYLHASEKDFTDIVDIECSIIEMKNLKIIRKSDLEILIEEAERAYDDFAYEYDNPGVDTSWSNTVACIKSQRRCIQAMKAEIERLKK